MSIHYEPQHLDLEEEGRCSLVLVAVRYTGPRSSIPAHRYRTQAAWPGHSAFQALGDDDDRQPGPPQFALLPDWTDEGVENRTVEAFEADEDFDVYYDRESIASALLELNYLPPNVFARGFEDRVRELVFDFLGIGYEGTDESQFRDILREIAGVEAADEEVQAETRDSERVTSYRRDHSRDQLADAGGILGFEDPSTAGKIELSTWLADQDREAVRFAFEGKADAARSVLAGDEPDAEPITADEAEEAYDFDELKDVVKQVREGTGEFSLRGVTAEDMAAFLVEDKGLTEDAIDGYLTG